MQVVVLAGGLATRMWPRTHTVPKSLLPVAGRAFIDQQLKLLAKHGATSALICVGFLGQQLREHLARHAPPVPVQFSADGDCLAGTGGALQVALKAGLLGSHFLVTYGDSYLPIDLEPLMENHLTSKNLATMTVLKNEGRWDQSNCAVEEGRVVCYDKNKNKNQATSRMRWIDYGMLALQRDWVASWQEIPPFDLSVLLSRLAASGELGAYLVEERFYEIGSFSGFTELDELLQKGEGR